MKIGEKIRLIRTKANLSQEAIAEKLNMSAKNYSNLESEKSKFSFQQVVEVAKVLDINILELLTTGDNEVAYIRDEQKGKGYLISKTLPMTYEALKQDCEYLTEKITLLDTLLATQKELIYRLEVENSELKKKK